jgi:hypothetical protein
MRRIYYLPLKDCFDPHDKSVFGFLLVDHLHNMGFHQGCKWKVFSYMKNSIN